MNLAQLRKFLVQQSGRYDLVVDDVAWVDNGANAILQAGQMTLDDMQELTHSPASLYMELLATADSIQFLWSRAIHSVYCIDNTTNAKWRLKKGIPPWVTGNREPWDYPGDIDQFDIDYDWSSIDPTSSQWPPANTGPPLFYKPINFRGAPGANTTGVPTSYMKYISSSAPLYDGLMVNPVADKSYTLEIHGLFYSEPLVNDTDQSFWSVLYPHILVMASQMLLEMFFRNSEGVQDWKNSIELLLDGIDKNIVSQQISGVRRLRG